MLSFHVFRRLVGALGRLFFDRPYVYSYITSARTTCFKQNDMNSVSVIHVSSPFVNQSDIENP